MALLRPMAQRPQHPSSTPVNTPDPVPRSLPARPANTPSPPKPQGSRPASPLGAADPAAPTADAPGQPPARGWGHGSSSAPPTPANLPKPAPASADDAKDRSSLPPSSPLLSQQAQTSASAEQAYESDGWIELEAATAPISKASLRDPPALAQSPPGASSSPP